MFGAKLSLGRDETEGEGLVLGASGTLGASETLGASDVDDPDDSDGTKLSLG